MTADTLSAEGLIELVARLRSLSGLLKLTPDESDACHDAAETIARLSTPELIALGEAAVAWNRSERFRGDSVFTDEARGELCRLARAHAHAASVAEVKHE